MEQDFTVMTPQQIEELKPFLMIVLAIPAILIARFIFFYDYAQIYPQALFYRG